VEVHFETHSLSFGIDYEFYELFFDIMLRSWILGVLFVLPRLLLALEFLLLKIMFYY